MKSALGYIVGLGLGFLGGWALNESALDHQLIAVGVALWLAGSLVGAALLVIVWLFAPR
jgi:hypothetical protein